MERLRARVSPLIWFSLLFLFAFPALSPFVTSAPTRSADGLLHLYRLVQLDALWRSGIFFSRWLPDLAYGYGLPLFNYYAPLVYYLTTPLHLLGIPFTVALNTSLAAALFVGALGMFCFTRALLESFASFPGEAKQNSSHSLAALVSALAFLYSPYVLFNALQRANLAEQWALAFAPFAFWRILCLLQISSVRNWMLAVLAFAAVMLSHNVTSFLFAPLILIFTLVCLFANSHPVTARTAPTTSMQRKYFVFLVPLSALFLSLALSAFFWLPALLERDYVQIARVIVTPDFDYRFNFVAPLELISLLPRADTGRLNPAFPSTLGIVQVILAFVGICILAARFRQRRVLPLVTLALAAVGFVALMLPLSQPVWDNSSLLTFVQLPMRLRGLVALCLAPIIGMSMLVIGERWRSIIALITVFALVLTALPMLYPRYAPDVPLNPSLAGMFAYEQATGTLGTTSFGEYLPVWVQNPPDNSPFIQAYERNQIPDRLVLPEGVTECGTQIQPTSLVVCASARDAWYAVVRSFYFPGWSVSVDGQPVQITPTPRTGLLSFRVAQGQTLAITYAGTPTEHLADWISIAGAVLFLFVSVSAFIAFLSRLSSGQRASSLSSPGDAPSRADLAAPRVFSFFAPLLFAALALIAFKTFYADRSGNLFVAKFDGTRVSGAQVERRVSFNSELELLGFDLNAYEASGTSAQSEMRRGQDLRVALYWRALPALARNVSTFVHLTEVNNNGTVVAQQDSLHPGHVPTSRWGLDTYVQDLHAFRIPDNLAPGVYDVQVGVYDSKTGERLKTANGNDSLSLQTIIVR